MYYSGNAGHSVIKSCHLETVFVQNQVEIWKIICIILFLLLLGVCVVIGIRKLHTNPELVEKWIDMEAISRRTSWMGSMRLSRVMSRNVSQPRSPLVCSREESSKSTTSRPGPWDCKVNL